ncbi:MAG: hypothetical protein PHZ09_05410 [Eubacteriales bacterium]|jgi:hypothetical protein|nr:hypothetical protein [Eubacteriales bacterium]
MTCSQFLHDLNLRSDERKYSIINSNPSAGIMPAGNILYVSNDGNDKNSGNSPDSAWATLDRVNTFSFGEGDTVLFARGGLWRGQLQCHGGVTYSAFGTGEKPKIYGSDYNYAKLIWEATDTRHVFVLSQPLPEDAGLIVFDNGKAHSYKKITGIDAFNGNPGTLINDLDMYHGDDRRIYLRSDKGNPSTRFNDIEIAAHRHAVTVAGDNVTIDNLCIMYAGSHGIGTSNRAGLTVQNCILGWIGGSMQQKGSSTRYGNAIEIYVSCRNFTVENCYIYEVYDAAITHQFKHANKTSVVMENVTYRGNLIENCSYSIEYFLDQTGNTGQIMRNILIEDNICRFAGFGWGDQRPDRNTPAHIKGWNHKNPAENFKIRNNVFDRSRYMMIHCGADDPEHLPVFEANTFVQFKDGGFGGYGKNPPDMTNYGETLCGGFFDSALYNL